MNIGGSGMSGREAIVTLVACVLLEFEAVPGVALSLAVLTGAGSAFYPSFLLYAALALIGGGGLGVVLLRQGRIRAVPRRAGSEQGRSWDSRWVW
jgi:hypothetical protein